ncbi:hypothetical protein IMG5_144340, partial [Ichthyophthirius multifiliis]
LFYLTQKAKKTINIIERVTVAIKYPQFFIKFYFFISLCFFKYNYIKSQQTTAELLHVHLTQFSKTSVFLHNLNYYESASYNSKQTKFDKLEAFYISKTNVISQTKGKQETLFNYYKFLLFFQISKTLYSTKGKNRFQSSKILVVKT